MSGFPVSPRPEVPPARAPRVAPTPQPPEPRGGAVRKIAFTALLVFTLLGAVAIAYFGVRLYPWLRGPASSSDQIDARWKKVENWAELPARSPGNAALLENVAGELGSYQAPRSREEIPTVDPESLDPGEREALKTFARWAQGGARMPDMYCWQGGVRTAEPLRLFRLGQAALFTAAGAEQLPQVGAVLALGHGLRQRGGLLELAVGASLAEKAAQWSRARDVALPPAFARYAPASAEIHAALAREATCMLRLFEAEATSGLSIDRDHIGIGRERPPLGIVSNRREIRVFKDFHGRLLMEMHAERDDWRKLADTYSAAAADPPKSVLLQITSTHPRVIRKVGEDIERYHALVPGSAESPLKRAK